MSQPEGRERHPDDRYRTEVVVLGVDGEFEQLLNQWHREGWWLHSCHVVPALSGPRTDPRTTVTTGLYVVLERRRL